VSYYDESVSFGAVTEQTDDPIVPEERFTFELIGMEKSPPDKWREHGGVKWTFNLFYPDGRAFEFQNELYELFRTTGFDMREGTYAHAWSEALLGRKLGVGERVNPRELRGKRMSVQVIWTPQKTDPKKKSIQLAALRHVPVNGGTAPAVEPSPVRPTVDERGALMARVQALLGEALLADMEGADKIRSAFKKSGREWTDEQLETTIGDLQLGIEEAKEAIPF